MKEYDVIVIGSGSGLSIVSKALERNMKVALVAERFIGGTCVNVGCVPSKTLIHPADVLEEAREAGKIGIRDVSASADFAAIMERMRAGVKKSVANLREWLEHTENLDLYEGRGAFSADHTMRLWDGREIRGRLIFVASGASPAVPPIEGLTEGAYLTNETLLSLDSRPDSMVILGGGYIGVEYAHFFASMGTKVAIVEMGERLVSAEEPEVSDLLAVCLKRRMSVYTSTKVLSVKRNGRGFTIAARASDGAEREVAGSVILVAAGRKSNAPTLSPGATGIELDGAGFVKVDDYLETTARDIWAVGDATGRQMFTHAADKEVEVAWRNATGGRRVRMDFSLVPHAVFSRPQIAAIGMREAEARSRTDVLVGRARYFDTVQGEVRMEEEGFAKGIVEKETGRILGFHIIGPEAPELIQEVVVAMTNNLPAKAVVESIHIFPAMSELIPEVLGNVS